MKAKAIETEYRGHLFRSRLEARWAVFFDTLGLEWQYEPQGYEVGQFSVDETVDADGKIRYLPDFYLPKQKTWIEVKGDLEPIWAKRIATFLDYTCPLPDFHGSSIRTDRNEFNPGVCPGFILLGDIPEPKFGLTFHKLVQHHKGLHCSWAMFTPYGVVRPNLYDEVLKLFFNFEGSLLNFHFDGWCESNRVCAKAFDTSPLFIDSPLGYQKVVDAYKAARQARFEHGQVGAPSQWRTTA